MSEPIHILSLGAGVQSSTLALMAAKGEVTPMPVAAIFADTQAEPKSVYTWLDWLEKQLPFPVIRVTRGNLTTYSLTGGTRADGRPWLNAPIPMWCDLGSGTGGGPMIRGCTREFKINPILKALRKYAKVPRACKTVRVIQWIGISVDEISRMKESVHPWLKNVWPLVDAGMKRHDCLLWMKRNGYPTPPRSACVYCPYHSNLEWRRLRDEEPDAFSEAVEFERKIQSLNHLRGQQKGMPYLHKSLIPLDQVDLSTDEERGQMTMFNSECEGMCGV